MKDEEDSIDSDAGSLPRYPVRVLHPETYVLEIESLHKTRIVVVEVLWALVFHSKC